MINKSKCFEASLLISLFISIIFLTPSCNSAIQNEVDSNDVVLQEDTIVKSTPPIVFDYDTAIWTNIKKLDMSIVTDIRYATDNNFVGEPIYDCAACFLRPETAKALVEVHLDAKKMGYGGIKVFDCYRPRPYQRRLWEKVPDPRFVGHPDKGSNHNRGLAVDLTIIDKSGEDLQMGTEFDEFSEKAYHTSPDIDSISRHNRRVLKDLMSNRGFKHLETEWWHYTHTLKSYKLSDWIWDCEVNEN